MADFNTDQRNRTRHKLLTQRGRTQESYMQTSRALMREMVRLQTSIRVDVQMLASAAAARDPNASLGEAVEWEMIDGTERTTDPEMARNWAAAVGVRVVRRASPGVKGPDIAG